MTSRTKRMRQRMLDSPPTISSERAEFFTAAIKEHVQEPAKLRLAKAFANVLLNMTIRIEPEELIVGNMGSTLRSCQIFPEYSWRWIEQELDRFEKRRTEKFLISEKDKNTLRKVFEYWSGRSTAEICATEMPEAAQRASKAGLFTIGAPGTGIGHVIVDYRRVLNDGLETILAETTLLKEAENDSEKLAFYEAVVIEIRAVIGFAERFAKLAEEQAKSERDTKRKKELITIAKTCRRVPAKPAQSFQEALQSFWFIQLVVQIESNGHSISTGRFDQYMHPYYVKDIESGRMAREEALELLEMLWIKFSSIIKLRNEYYSTAFAGHPMFQNLTIGGQDSDGNDVCNEVTDLILEATANVRVTQPTVSFRWHKNTPENTKMKVTEVVSQGLGMPGLFNDEIIIPLMAKKGTDKEEMHNYSVLGCVEPIIEGKSDPRANIGYVNLLRILEVTLNGGKDPRTGNMVGAETGNPQDFESFNELWNAYEQQIDHAIDLLTSADRIAAGILASEKPTPLISALLQDCLINGRTMQEGGAKYSSGGIMGVGVAMVADSLSMIRKYVFEKKQLTMSTLLEALADNFEEHEELRARLDNDSEKYGNDLEKVDMLARDTGKVFCKSIQSRMTTRDGPYHGALFSVSMYIPQGETVGATPDGRKAGLMLSDGVSPAHSRDIHGPTAAMKSVARLDHELCYNGTLYNMKFMPHSFDTEAGRKRFIGLVDAYFELGGLHVQFNVVDRETLEDAKVNPQLHRDLIVRVAGYSAYFIELDPFVQNEAIARTEFST